LNIIFFMARNYRRDAAVGVFVATVMAGCYNSPVTATPKKGASHNWEHEKARPRRAQLAALVAVRGVGKREALKKLAELQATKKRGRRKARR
jgi:hypothetical protein